MSHGPVFTIPVFRGTSPDKFQCSERENGCQFEVAVSGGLTKEEAEAKFIAEHPKEEA
jgi:hypothetical protein